MRTFKNIAVILFWLVLGNSTYAATSQLFAEKTQKFIDPSLAKISSHFDFQDDKVDNSPITNYGAANTCSQASLAFYPLCIQTVSCSVGPLLKKSYLFTTSGLSPPQSV
jgi:hypothetical protein